MWLTRQQGLRFYWFLVIGTALLSAVILVGQFAIFLTFVTLGLALFLMIGVGWVLTALLLLMPAVHARTARGRVAGVIGAVVVACVLIGIGPFLESTPRNRVLPDEIRASVPVATSWTVDIADLGETGCDTICWRLLTGSGVSAVRVSEGLAYLRAPSGQCRVFAPDFPEETPCIVAATDAPNGPELAVRITETGFDDGAGRLLFQPLRQSVLQVSAPDGVVWQKGALDYVTRTPWPLFSFVDQEGRAAYRMLFWTRRMPSPDSLVALSELGLVPGIPEPTKAVRIGPTVIHHPLPRPQNAIIVASMLEAGIAANDPHMRADAHRFLTGLRTAQTLSGLSDTLLGRIASDPVLSEVPGFAAVAGRVPETSQGALSTEELIGKVAAGGNYQAAGILAARLMADPPGTHAAHAEAYRAILDGSVGSFPYALMNGVGRMGFDPMPYLQRWRSKDQRDPYRAMTAACFSSPDWDNDVLSFARGYLDARASFDGGTRAKTAALRILVTRGFEDEAEERLAALHAPDIRPKRSGHRRLRKGSYEAWARMWRERMRREIREDGCNDLPDPLGQ